MAPSRDEVIAAARALWGNENPSLSSKAELRFGNHGSKSLNLKDLTWYDHEAEDGGGWSDLFEMAGVRRESADSSSWIIYDYRDEKSELVFQVIRKPGRTFTQRRPDPAKPGEWIWSTKGIRRVLYRLPQVLKSSADAIVWVCEGEKDADNLARLGCVTTTNPGGTGGGWRSDYSQSLKDRIVVILPDNDSAGIEHAAKVHRSLAGIAKSATVLYLPGLPHKGDVTDWIHAGGNADKLYELLANPPPPPEPPPPGGHGGHGETPQDFPFITNQKGEPLPVVENAYVALANDPELKDKYKFDQMRRSPMVAKSPPVPVEDDDVIDLQRYLQRNYMERVTRNTTSDAILNYSMDHAYDPLKDQLEGLVWDGEPRLNGAAVTYLGCEKLVKNSEGEESNYNDEVFAMFVVSMVARIYRPGCKADHMLVLEGPQGMLKSMACEVLAGEQYFSDHLPDIGNSKEVSQHLRGKWVIEISEMHAFNKAEATALKAFLSRTHERYRPPYHRLEVDEPRRCVFIGTSNKDAYLRDETGGRRFWPIKTGEIDIDALRRDRDQILAEAVAEFKRGVQWWPSREFERDHIAPQQEERYEFDEWYDTIRNHVALLKTTTITDVAKGCLEFKIDRLDIGVQRRIGAILRKIGFISKHQKNRRWWERLHDPSLYGDGGSDGDR